MAKKMKVYDESSEKKYFTIIPNYILNHSTLYDREVYIQMKRITGEDGECWTSRETLAKQCGISVRRLDKSIQYLLDHDWIRHSGTKKINTRGGAQVVNTYKVVDLWKKNMDFYASQGCAQDATPLPKGGARSMPKGMHGRAKGGAPGAYKEEPINNNKEEEIFDEIKRQEALEKMRQISAEFGFKRINK
jgi:Helix-turn-helix domain